MAGDDWALSHIRRRPGFLGALGTCLARSEMAWRSLAPSAVVMSSRYTDMTVPECVGEGKSSASRQHRKMRTGTCCSLELLLPRLVSMQTRSDESKVDL